MSRLFLVNHLPQGKCETPPGWLGTEKEDLHDDNVFVPLIKEPYKKVCETCPLPSVCRDVRTSPGRRRPTHVDSAESGADRRQVRGVHPSRTRECPTRTPDGRTRLSFWYGPVLGVSRPQTVVPQRPWTQLPKLSHREITVKGERQGGTRSHDLLWGTSYAVQTCLFTWTTTVDTVTCDSFFDPLGKILEKVFSIPTREVGRTWKSLLLCGLGIFVLYTDTVSSVLQLEGGGGVGVFVDVWACGSCRRFVRLGVVVSPRNEH